MNLTLRVNIQSSYSRIAERQYCLIYNEVTLNFVHIIYINFHI